MIQPDTDTGGASRRTPSFPEGFAVALAALVVFQLALPPEVQGQRSRDASSTRSSSSSSSGSSSSGSSSSGSSGRVSGSSSSSSRTAVSRGSSGSSRSDRVGGSSTGHRDPDRDRLADRRGNRSSRGSGGYRGGRHGGYYGYYGGYYGGYHGGYYHPYYGHYYPSFRLHYYPYPYYYPLGWGAYGVRPYRAESGAPGALDLNVKPEKADVYLDGQLIGPVDRYDGFPGYLWLEPGTYDIAFYKPGFETLVLQYKVYPGVVVRVNERMIPGEAIHPAEISPYGSAAGTQTSYREPEPAVGEPLAEGWAPGPEVASATLRLDVSPGDTSIYVDGQFVGTASELTEIELPAGEHRVELVRPGHEAKSVTLQVDPGEAIDLRMALSRRG